MNVTTTTKQRHRWTQGLPPDSRVYEADQQGVFEIIDRPGEPTIRRIVLTSSIPARELLHLATRVWELESVFSRQADMRRAAPAIAQGIGDRDARIAALEAELATAREVRDLFAKGPEALEKAILARIRRELKPVIERLQPGDLRLVQEFAHVRLVLCAALNRICPEG